MNTIAKDFPNFDPIEYASHGNAILGIRDSGKTVTAMGRAEHLIDAGIPITVVDPIGVWRFLRVPGKGKGYPVVVAGGMEGDLPLTPENTESIVRAAMQNRVSIVLDLYTMELSKADWKRICASAIRTMLYENKQYGLRHVFIEEAAEFCPQRVGPDQGRVYAEMEKLARMGGNALLGYTLINQRAEEVNKAVLELCDTLILHRQKGRNSLNALTKWLKIAGAKGDTSIVESMPTLKQGEAWAWLSGSDKPVRIQIPMKNSFHPDRRSIAGTGAHVEKAAAVDVDAFVTAMRETLTKEGKKESPDQKFAKTLGREAIDQFVNTETVDASRARDEGYREGFEAGHQAGYEKGYSAGNHVGCGSADAMVRYITEQLPAAINGVVSEAIGLRTAQEVSQDIDKPAPAKLTPGQERERFKEEWNKPARFIPTAAPAKANGQGGGAELRILRVLAARSPARFSKAQWATLSGMKRTGGTWQTYVSRLRQAGYLDEREDGTVGLTAAGIRAAGHVDRPRAGSVIEDWKNSLGSGPAKMIDELVRLHPQPMDRANLADRVGMTATGGTFQTYLSRLKTNGLIEISGRKIKASPTLFVDARH